VPVYHVRPETRALSGERYWADRVQAGDVISISLPYEKRPDWIATHDAVKELDHVLRTPNIGPLEPGNSVFADDYTVQEIADRYDVRASGRSWC
jgi:hypothetical protein